MVGVVLHSMTNSSVVSSRSRSSADHGKATSSSTTSSGIFQPSLSRRKSNSVSKSRMLCMSFGIIWGIRYSILEGFTTLWDVESGEALWDFTHENSATSIAFSTDNRYMATRFSGEDPDVRCIKGGTTTAFQIGNGLKIKSNHLQITHEDYTVGLLVFHPMGSI